MNAIKMFNKYKFSDFLLCNLIWKYENTSEKHVSLSFLTHSFPMHPFSAPENIKPYHFLMFSGGRERVH